MISLWFSWRFCLLPLTAGADADSMKTNSEGGEDDGFSRQRKKTAGIGKEDGPPKPTEGGIPGHDGRADRL